MLPSSIRSGYRILLALMLVAFGLTQIAAALVGTYTLLGTVWVWVAMSLLAAAGLALPIAFGACFGAIFVWHWHWSLAAVFAAPRLVLVLPGVVAALLAKLKYR